MKNKLLPILCLLFVGLLAVTVFARVPPPPTNQNFGVLDTTMVSYNETLCRGCHNTTSSPIITGGVPTRHHLLVQRQTTNPYTGQPFACTDCHPSTPGSGNGILMNRNCMDCHNITAFTQSGARVGNFTRPHHNTTNAQIRNCKYCHGASVDDYNDGHYIPSYPPSEITPTAMFTIFNSTSGRLWGGCLACHAEDKSASPPIYFDGTNVDPVNGRWPSSPITTGVNNVHHSEIIGITNTGDINGQCLWCHVNVQDVLNIRGCETCHSVRAIHNTQFDYPNTSTLIGYGHVGSSIVGNNNSWDCNGCHATWGSPWSEGSTNPFAGAIVPDVQSVTPDILVANTPTVLTLTGSNFVQENSTTVVNIDDTTNIAPTTLTSQVITVTVNLPAGNHYIKVVKTDATENVPKPSNIKSLTVVSTVSITSAKLYRGVITIAGTGFGARPASNAQQYVTISHAGNVYYSDSISSWSNTQIKAKKTSTPAAVKGDIVTVVTANGGEASATIS